MKRDDDHVDLSLYAALFQDIVAWDQGLAEPLAVDLQRLGRLVETRGISVVMIDLPEAGKVVDQALSRGKLSAKNLPHTFGKVIGEGSREFLSCLFKKVFSTSSGKTYVDLTDHTSVFFLRQVLYLAKKIEKECSDAANHTEVSRFLEIEDSCRSPTLKWDCDYLDPLGKGGIVSFLDAYRSTPDLVSGRDECPRPLVEVFERVADITACDFGQFDWRDVLPRHGPGAVSDAVRGTDKFLFPRWTERLGKVFPYEYFAQHREDLHHEAPQGFDNLEPMAKLIAVPKTLDKPRLIASEPVAHQYLQGGLLRWLRENIPNHLRYCTDFHDQSISRDLCLMASKTGKLATVDLSSASDRLSCWTVERFFRKNPVLLEALWATRTSQISCDKYGHNFKRVLKKYAPQGNATTFPIQTIIYASACIAAILYDNGGGRRLSSAKLKSVSRKLQVFGDDILIPSPNVTSLGLLLSYLGLKVNVSKTHYEGSFRESCGMDAYDGEDVSPLYLSNFAPRRDPSGLSSWCDVINNAHIKGLWCLSARMAELLNPKLRDLIPISDKPLGCLTLRTFCSGYQAKKTRQCRHLQTPVVLGLVPKSKERRKQREDHRNLLQYFVEDPSPDSTWKSGWTVKTTSQLVKGWVTTY